MWYVIALIVLILVNWPLKLLMMRRVAKRSGILEAHPVPFWRAFLQLGVQLIAIVSIVWLGLSAAGSSCGYPFGTTVWVCITEALFLAVAVDSTMEKRISGGRRARQYLLASLCVMQWAVSPVSRTSGTLSAGFAVYSFLGFNKAYIMGFVMIHDQINKSPDGLIVFDKLSPMCSVCWPLFPVMYAVVAPSTNWLLAGNLTYPYFSNAMDRVLYISGALLVIFTMHRASQEMQNTKVLPKWLEFTGLMLYLLHPAVVTISVRFGINDVATLWAGTVVVALMLVLLLRVLH